MGDVPQTVEAALARALRPHLDAAPWFVAFSGGIDSTALLLALSRLCSQGLIAPSSTMALHINHGLATDADAWAAHCVRISKKLHIDCRVQRVVVQPAGDGPEAAARRARYAVFREALGSGGRLLLGHHQDDQVETFFLRLMRGAGVQGLAGMPAERPLGQGLLLRPFLDLPRHLLRDYVVAAGVPWIEDPSNRDLRYDRNFLRQAVLPLLAQRWPGYRGPVTRAMTHLADQDALLQPPLLAVRRNAFGDPGCDSAPLCDMPAAQAAGALRRWLRELGCAPPPREPLLEFLRQLRAGHAGSTPRLQRRDWCLQRYGDAIYLLPPPWPFTAPPPRPVLDGDCLEIPGVGRVGVSAPEGSESPLLLGFRRGGERIRLPGETRHRALKTLLQAASVPPWWRERLPLLSVGDRLLAVGDLWRAAGARATLVWERAPGHCSD